ncbi:MAG: transporter substrate-binding domain-containing protein [Clostridia bacterium]
MKSKLFRRRKRASRSPFIHTAGQKTFWLYRRDNGSAHYGENFARGNRRLHEQQAPGRHKLHITLVGDEGRLWRRILGGAAAFVLLVVLILSMRKEPQLMNMPEISTIKEEGILKVGVLDGVVGMSNNGAGLEVEIALKLGERMLPGTADGDAVKYIPVTSKIAAAKLSDGTVNVVAAMMKKDALPQFVYSEPYYSDTCRFVIKMDERIAVSGITVGCLQKSPELALLNSYIEAKPQSNINKKLYAAYDDMLSALTRGDVDAVVMTDVRLNMYDSAYNIIGAALELGKVDYAFACAKDSPAIAEIANMVLDEMRENGELDAMLVKYGLN